MFAVSSVGSGFGSPGCCVQVAGPVRGRAGAHGVRVCVLLQSAPPPLLLLGSAEGHAWRLSALERWSSSNPSACSSSTGSDWPTKFTLTSSHLQLLGAPHWVTHSLYCKRLLRLMKGKKREKGKRRSPRTSMGSVGLYSYPNRHVSSVRNYKGWVGFGACAFEVSEK